MASSSETGQSSEDASPEGIMISVNDIMKMKLEDLRTTVENKKMDIEELSIHMYDTAKKIYQYVNHGNQVSMKIKYEKYSSVFEEILNSLLIGKKKQTWDPNELIQLLTGKYQNQSLSVLYVVFKQKSAKVIRKLFELLTFDINGNNEHDGVIVNGLTPMIDAICINKRSNVDGNTSQVVTSNDSNGTDEPDRNNTILSCLEYLVEDDDDDEGDGGKIAEVMDIEPIRKVESVYNKMTTIVYMAVIVVHTLYMSLFSYSSMFLMDKILNGTGIDGADPQTVIFYADLPIEPAVFIVFYAAGFRRIYQRMYKKYHNRGS